MNATLFENFAPSKAGLMPNQGELITLGWATTVTRQLVRSAGFAGSIVANLSMELTSNMNIYRASGEAALPGGAYGTSLPPAIFSCVQYGSAMVVYKTLSYGEWRFRTWISDLRPVENLPEVVWTFKVNHYSNLKMNWLDQISPLFYGYIPPEPDQLTLNGKINPTVTLYWYAMGFNPELSISGGAS